MIETEIVDTMLEFPILSKRLSSTKFNKSTSIVLYKSCPMPFLVSYFKWKDKDTTYILQNCKLYQLYTIISHLTSQWFLFWLFDFTRGCLWCSAAIRFPNSFLRPLFDESPIVWAFMAVIFSPQTNDRNISASKTRNYS